MRRIFLLMIFIGILLCLSVLLHRGTSKQAKAIFNISDSALIDSVERNGGGH